MKTIIIGIVGALALVVAFLGYSVFKPPAQATAPIQSVATATTGTTATAGSQFQIVSSESQARFVIDEVLNGSPKTVVGTTDQVAGQISIDPSDADAAQVGTILINARTLATDSTQRDRAIQNRVLLTEQYEYITFVPQSFVGLPQTLQANEQAAFKIVGDLTIRNVTRQVTFDATMALDSVERLSGKASTSIAYTDWGISIPQVPSVANVSEQLQLQLDFVATTA